MSCSVLCCELNLTMATNGNYLKQTAHFRNPCGLMMVNRCFSGTNECPTGPPSKRCKLVTEFDNLISYLKIIQLLTSRG